ncbi:hypothetical protein B0H10DRAFT_2212558 [Mycena sp. CBHHK59/15]|nr:hypothetical protein B0H10DRAFT_2212558 [Mycena sp. CBHHK59/15]
MDDQYATQLSWPVGQSEPCTDPSDLYFDLDSEAEHDYPEDESDEEKIDVYLAERQDAWIWAWAKGVGGKWADYADEIIEAYTAHLEGHEAGGNNILSELLDEEEDEDDDEDEDKDEDDDEDDDEEK